MQDMQEEVEGGKLLNAGRSRVFEDVIAAVENATPGLTRREEISRIALQLPRARKAQQAADERKSHHEGVSPGLHANIEG